VTRAREITDLATEHTWTRDKFLSYWLFRTLHIVYSCSHKWQNSHCRSELWINSFGYTELSAFDSVCLCLCSDWTRKYCARTEAEGNIWSEDRGSSRRMDKIAQWGAAWFVLVSEWWWVGNWKTTGQEKRTGEIKNTQKSLVGNSDRKRTLRDLGLDKMIKSMWWTGHKELQCQLPSAQ